uniref:Uncharacterized protein n=1 Tax=Eutreptiella gymnastica TaxID=73025 RepID=A0A7S4CZG3_9EUGL|mmetsp:Transcript_22532/g.38473  ORF Transcript_22532/g.38473 Transcript_22532/m.38473 type:complete len:106 (+) Transcript_22532:461-778(+)
MWLLCTLPQDTAQHPNPVITNAHNNTASLELYLSPLLAIVPKQWQDGALHDHKFMQPQALIYMCTHVRLSDCIGTPIPPYAPQSHDFSTHQHRKIPNPKSSSAAA